MDFIVFAMYDFFNFLTNYSGIILGIIAVVGGLITFIGRHPRLALYIMDHYGQFYMIAEIKFGKQKAKLIGFVIKILNQLKSLYPIVKNWFMKTFTKGKEK